MYSNFDIERGKIMKIAKLIALSALTVSLSFVSTSAFASTVTESNSIASSVSSPSLVPTKQGVKYVTNNVNVFNNSDFYYEAVSGGAYAGTVYFHHSYQSGSSWIGVYYGTVSLNYQN